MWGWIGWVAVALAAWVVVAAVVGILLGRMIRQRDRQVPLDDGAEAVPPPRSTAEGRSAH